MTSTPQYVYSEDILTYREQFKPAAVLRILLITCKKIIFTMKNKWHIYLKPAQKLLSYATFAKTNAIFMLFLG